MLPDVLHFALMLLLVGGLLRVAMYELSQKLPNNPVYKYMAFAY